MKKNILFASVCFILLALCINMFSMKRKRDDRDNYDERFQFNDDVPVIKRPRVDNYLHSIVSLIKEGKLDDAKRDIEGDTFGYDYNMPIDHNDNAVFHVAAKYGDVEIVKSLIEKKNIVASVGNKKGDTPLHIAIENGKYGVAFIFLSHECSHEEYDRTHLKKNGKAQTPVGLLIEKAGEEKSDDFKKCLNELFIRVVRDRNLVIAQKLLDVGVDINYYSDSMWYDYKEMFEHSVGGNAAHAGFDSCNTEEEYWEMAKFLVKNEANLNKENEHGETPFDIVIRAADVRNKEFDLVKLLNYLVYQGGAVCIPKPESLGSLDPDGVKFAIDCGAYKFMEKKIFGEFAEETWLFSLIEKSYVYFPEVRLCVLNGGCIKKGLWEKIDEQEENSEIAKQFLEKVFYFRKLSKKEKYNLVVGLLQDKSVNNKNKEEKELYITLLFSEAILKLADLLDEEFLVKGFGQFSYKKIYNQFDYKNTVLYKLFISDVGRDFITAVDSIFNSFYGKDKEYTRDFFIFVKEVFETMLKNKHEISKLKNKHEISKIALENALDGLAFLRDGSLDDLDERERREFLFYDKEKYYFSEEVFQSRKGSKMQKELSIVKFQEPSFKKVKKKFLKFNVPTLLLGFK